MAAEGNDVIVDELSTHPWWLDDWRDVLRGARWWSVLLKASLSVLAERETLREDRPLGLAAMDAAGEADAAHFDLVIDTDGKSVGACVGEICRASGLCR